VKIYTRTGDGGETSLFGGGRVPKDAIRVAAYGSVDELNAALGFAASLEPTELAAELIDGIQRDLFAIGAQLASPDPAKVEKTLAKAQLTESRIGELEQAIDEVDAELPSLTAFVLPGGSPKAAALHVARTSCRRAERHVVALGHHEAVPAIVLKYLNRLSDLLFTLARLANHRGGTADRTW
jgi:cob(I)alamin adenosyltransferase